MKVQAGGHPVNVAAWRVHGEAGQIERVGGHGGHRGAVVGVVVGGEQRPRVDAGLQAAVERARQYLDAHYTRVVGSGELEAVSGLDRYALARHFRTRLGASPYRYLTMRRLDRVRARLRAGDALADAAADCGFADQSHMTRQFKRADGVAPGQWQRLLSRQDMGGP